MIPEPPRAFVQAFARVSAWTCLALALIFLAAESYEWSVLCSVGVLLNVLEARRG